MQTLVDRNEHSHGEIISQTDTANGVCVCGLAVFSIFNYPSSPYIRQHPPTLGSMITVYLPMLKLTRSRTHESARLFFSFSFLLLGELNLVVTCIRRMCRCQPAPARAWLGVCVAEEGPVLAKHLIRGVLGGRTPNLQLRLPTVAGRANCWNKGPDP